MSEELTELIIRVFIICVAVTWLVIVWRMDQSEAMPNFSFKNLIATRDGYPDRAAVMELGAWLAMTAVIIIAVLRTASELATLCGIYVGAFTLRGGASAWIHATKPQTPGKTVTTQTSATQTRTVEAPKEPEKFT